MSLPVHPFVSRLPFGWVLGLLGGLVGMGSNAQTQETTGLSLTLRPSSMLQEVIPDEVRKQSPKATP
jgi:hypothetical protein